MYGVIGIYLTSKIADRVVEGFHYSKAVYIISDQWSEIADAVMQKMYMLSDGMTSAELKKELQPLIDSNSGFKYEALYMLSVKYIDEGSNRAELEKIVKSLKDKDAEIPNFFKAGFARISSYLNSDKVLDNSQK